MVPDAWAYRRGQRGSAEQEDARKGDVVLVAEDNQPPHQWITARVVETHAGADGRVRVADVRTSAGAVFRRAVHKLARLPVVEA
ncbi:hypothetical protein KR067_004360 [Drosophila pandora]|nr:hypothetical protein KR067_004360 [Drosophila pandora]